MDIPDIPALNCITAEIAETPEKNPMDWWQEFYSRDDAIRHQIRVYYTDRDEVIIVGVADNNYSYWLSVTKTDDIQTNRKIFDYIYRMKPKLFSDECFALENTEYTWEQFQHFYYADLTTADEILTHRSKVQALCRIREAKGKYQRVMLQYLRRLQSRSSNPHRDYEKIRQMYELIRAERYLLCSEHAEIRDLYIRLEESSEEIYQRYMDEARGGA